MGLRVKLDGNILANTPIGWEDATIKTKMDRIVKGLFINYTTDLDFWGDGFDYLDNVLEENYCQTVKIVIESNECSGDWEEEYTGVIQLAQITKYDVNKRIIKTKLFDDSYDSQISNNKSLKAYVDVPVSKNGELIDVAPQYNIEFFNPTAIFPTYLPILRVGYKVYDCLKFIIDYMSDGTVDFKSDIFANDYNNWMLFNGKEVRKGAGDGFQLEVSFKELFKELDKKANLSFAIEPSDGANDFRLRLEPTNYFEQNNAVVILDNIDNIEMSFNRQELYSNVDIGSTSFEDDVFSTSYPPLNFKAFKEENYTILGDCNIDKTLNLVSKYIIDTNVIEDAVVNDEDRYDKKIFLIVTDGAKCVKYKEYDDPVVEGTDVGVIPFQLQDNSFPFAPVSIGDMVININTNDTAGVVSKTGANILTLDADIFTSNDDYQVRTNPYNYNHPLTNVEVITRFLGGIPNSVVKHIGAGGTAPFRAEYTQLYNSISNFPHTIAKIPYDDDSTPPNFDSGNNYDNTTYEYTVPASGLFGFRAFIGLILYNYSKNIIQNGDFSNGLNNWDQNSGAIYSGNVFSDNDSSAIPQPKMFFLGGAASNNYLRQYMTINPYTNYVIKFKAKYYYDGSGNVFGSAGRDPFHISCNGSPQVYVNSSGWANYEIQLNYFSSANPPQYIEFKFHGIGTQISLKDIRVEEQNTYKFTHSINRTSPSGGSVQSFQNVKIVPISGGTFQQQVNLFAEDTFPTFSNDRISSSLKIEILSGNTSTQLFLRDGGYFQTLLTDDGGGDILPQDPTDAPIFKYKFEKSMSRKDFELLRDNPEAAILFSNTETNHIFGWRNSIKWERKSGIAEFELRSKTKIKGNC
jgi:hypothetical protein